MAHKNPKWDHSSDEQFYDYYANLSTEEQSIQRLRNTCSLVLAVCGAGIPKSDMKAVDVGCGAGPLSIILAEEGFQVFGIDVNEPLIELARRRASDAGLSIKFEVGSATEIPLPSSSVDICMAPELLEHVSEWETCLNEFARILKPNGVLFLSTTNKLCPIQSEFNLPFYSWYPNAAKRYFEKRASTNWPQIANYAKYPAVNWFTYYSLRKSLRQRGFEFDG